MKILTEKQVHTKDFAGTVDLITGIDDFDTKDLTYNSEFHTYRYKNKIIPSVTQLLDKGEYTDVDPEILKYAQDKGTLIHKEIEVWWNTQKEGFTDEFYKFLDLFIENKKMFENEALWDYKTYAAATPEKRKKCYEQMEYYSQGIEYLTGKKITQFYMIHLPHNKKGKIIDLTEEFRDEI